MINKPDSKSPRQSTWNHRQPYWGFLLLLGVVMLNAFKKSYCIVWVHLPDKR